MTFLTCFEVSATLVSLKKVSYAAVFSFSDSQARHRSSAPLIGACRISHRSPSTAPMRSSLMPEVGVAFFTFILVCHFLLKIVWTSILAFKAKLSSLEKWSTVWLQDVKNVFVCGTTASAIVQQLLILPLSVFSVKHLKKSHCTKNVQTSCVRQVIMSTQMAVLS